MELVTQRMYIFDVDANDYVHKYIGDYHWHFPDR